MASLADAIKQAGQAVQGPGPETGGQTQLAQRLITAKQTGKAPVTGQGPQRATEGERVADSVAAQEQRVVQTDTLTKLAALRDSAETLKKQTSLTADKQSEQMTSLIQNSQNRTADFLQQMQQEDRSLSLQESQSRLEQGAFNLRLGNNQYLQELQDTGRRERLGDSISFKEEMQRQIFADQTSLLEDDLAFKEMMTMDDATFQKLLATIDSNAALQMASDSAKSAGQTAIWTGVGQIGSVAADYFSKQKTTTPTPGGDTSGEP